MCVWDWDRRKEGEASNGFVRWDFFGHQSISLTSPNDSNCNKNDTCRMATEENESRYVHTELFRPSK